MLRLVKQYFSKDKDLFLRQNLQEVEKTLTRSVIQVTDYLIGITFKISNLYTWIIPIIILHHFCSMILSSANLIVWITVPYIVNPEFPFSLVFLITFSINVSKSMSAKQRSYLTLFFIFASISSFLTLNYNFLIFYRNTYNSSFPIFNPYSF